MSCTYHIRNQVSFICIAPHKCQCQRKLCAQCQYEHGVDLKSTLPIQIFEDMVKMKFQGSSLDSTSELVKHRMNFKTMLSSTQNKLKQIWDGLEESIKQIYDLIEMEDKFYLNFIKNIMNPTELSNTELEKLVQIIIIGKPLDDWNDQKNSQLKRLEMTKQYWEMETRSFCEKLNEEMKEILQFIKKDNNSQLNIQQLREIKQVYNRKEDFYQILIQTKNIDDSYLNELLQLLKKQKISNCIEFFKDQTQLKFIASMIKNLSELDFNKKNYSTENNEQIRKDLIKKISYDYNIIEFFKFLVQLTAIDERFIQCGSNSLNLLVEMKVDLREHSFENIRIKDTSLIGGNFLRCNFNGSEFDNVDISGMNLNQAQLFNCKWKNIKIHELNRLDGHSQAVNSVNFSPDGTTLASGSDDNSIRLWDVKTGQQKAKLDGHSKYVMSVNFSPDGTTLASGSADNSIRLWDVKTGQQKAKLDGHSHYVRSINFSPDGTTLASGSEDKSIRLWDVKTGQQKAKLDGHSSAVLSVNFSPDGTTLASGSRDNSIRLWDVKTGQQKAKLDGHSDYVTSVNFSPDGTTLASGSWDNSIRLWDVKTGQQQAKLDGNWEHERFNFSPDGSTFISVSVDQSLSLWDVKTGLLKGKLDGHQFVDNQFCFSPDGKILASGSSDMFIHLCDVETGQYKFKLFGNINNFCFLPDGQRVATYNLNQIESKFIVSSENNKTISQLNGFYSAEQYVNHKIQTNKTDTLGIYSDHNPKQENQPIQFWDLTTGVQILPSEEYVKVNLLHLKFLKNPHYCINSAILEIHQNPNLTAQGAQIWQGEFTNHQRNDLKSVFKTKGCLILEESIKYKKNY